MFMSQALLRLPACCERLGLSRASVYSLIRCGLLTPPVRLGTRSVAWPSGEIDQYVDAKIRGADNDELRDLVARLVEDRCKSGRNVGLSA